MRVRVAHGLYASPNRAYKPDDGARLTPGRETCPFLSPAAF